MIGQRYKVISANDGPHLWSWPDPEDWTLELYDLVNDPAEQEDLAEQRPAILEEKEQVMRDWLGAVRAD